MTRRTATHSIRFAAAAVMAGVLALPVAATPAAAEPPPWAPAHGYRAKHKGPQVVRPVYYEPGRAIDLPTGSCNRELIGQVLGGAAGAAAGSQIGSGSGRLIAIAGGTILGVLIGGEVGASMDRADAACVDHALEFAEAGQPIAWNDPDGDRYRVVPQQVVETSAGAYCREYTATSVIGGRERETWGTACRRPDGSWQIVDSRG